jgi:hypothetical protein
LFYDFKKEEKKDAGSDRPVIGFCGLTSHSCLMCEKKVERWGGLLPTSRIII